MVLKKTSINTTKEFQIQFDDNEGFSELYNFFLCQSQLKTLLTSPKFSSFNRGRADSHVIHRLLKGVFDGSGTWGWIGVKIRAEL